MTLDRRFSSFGIHIPLQGTYDYQAALKVSTAADKLGYDYLWVGDHFFLPSPVYSKIGGDPERPNKLDAWTTLAAIAAKTERIKLGTRVSPLPFYLPSRLAKIVTTVDIISDGRINLGAGTGWFKDEAVSYGLGWWSYKERILRMKEALEIILRLWTEERATYNGKYYQIENAPFWPKPVQKPHPPIWFGGTSKSILRAAVQYGNGLLPPPDIPIKDYESFVSKVRETEKRLGKTKSLTLVPCLSYPDGLGKDSSKWLETVKAYFEKDAASIVIDFCQNYTPHNAAIKFLEEFARKVFPHQ